MELKRRSSENGWKEPMKGGAAREEWIRGDYDKLHSCIALLEDFLMEKND